MEREVLWRRVIEKKYVSLWGGWSVTVFNGSQSVSLCKYIKRDWENFLCFIKCGVGDRIKLKF